jgi:hypothetical protein
MSDAAHLAVLSLMIKNTACISCFGMHVWYNVFITIVVQYVLYAYVDPRPSLDVFGKEVNVLSLAGIKHKLCMSKTDA